MSILGKIGLIVIAGLLVACQSPPDEVATATPPEPGYPGPASSPAATAASGYPAAPPTTGLPANPYPEGSTVWITHPAGLQCGSPQFPDLASAVAALVGAGIEVLEAEEFERLTCEACTCPTSAHYRIRIRAGDLAQATALAWEPEP
jgi:hypothetical protein